MEDWVSFMNKRVVLLTAKKKKNDNNKDRDTGQVARGRWK